MYIAPFLHQKLACLLYKAADDGDVDPFLVSRVLGVTKNKAKVFVPMTGIVF